MEELNSKRKGLGKKIRRKLKINPKEGDPRKQKVSKIIFFLNFKIIIIRTFGNGNVEKKNEVLLS